MREIQTWLLIILMLGIIMMAGCASVNHQSAAYQQSASELEDILKAGNLTESQKIILQHAAINLQTAGDKDKKIAQLQEQVTESSRLSAWDRIAYVIAGSTIIIIGYKIVSTLRG